MNTRIREDFVLADDRAQALESLVPGTEDHLFHRGLLLQHTGQLAEVEGLLVEWRRRFGETTRRHQIEQRQALLTYHEDLASQARIASWLGLRTDHPSPLQEEARALPSRLAPALLAPEAILAAGAAVDRLQGFSDDALPWLARTPLARERRGALLARLRRPDVDGLVALVEQELEAANRPSFGTLPIHRRLTLDQLDQLLAGRPALLAEAAFVDTYLQRLRPPAGVDLDQDEAAEEAHLDRLDRFTARLPPAFASYHAHVRYHRLALDRRRGVLDRGRLLEYLATPRYGAQIAPDLLARAGHAPVRLDIDFGPTLGLPPPGDDAELVRDLVGAALAEDLAITPFQGLLRTEYLTALRAEVRLLAGAPDQERWVAELGPAGAFTVLRDRVELTLAPTNPRRFAADAPVRLAVDAKNVPSLVVRVFALHERNIFLETGQQADLAIDLDGLIATEERVLPLDLSPLRRARHTLDFPSIERPGTFVIDILGGGRSCRAIVRKGRLRKLERVSSAGHALTIVDDHGTPVAGATAWVNGREYAPDASGEIIVPFATGAPRKALLCQGELTTLVYLRWNTESYALLAGFDLPREALLGGQKASIVLRAGLTVGGMSGPGSGQEMARAVRAGMAVGGPASVSLGLLEEPTLVISSTDRKGATTERTIPGLTFDAGHETTVEFQVPEGLRTLSFTLRGKVRKLTDGSHQEVSAQHEITLNRVDDGESTSQLHLARRADGYALLLLGKSGEVRPAEVVHLQLTHGYLARPIEVRLRTDGRGEIALGPLAGITALQAHHGPSPAASWPITRGTIEYPEYLHLRAGSPILLPLPDPPPRVDAQAFSLLEQRGGGYQRDCLDRLSLRDGFLEVGGLDPGDYELRLLGPERLVQLRVREAHVHHGWQLTESETLGPTPYRPLRIASLSVDGDQLRLAVTHASPRARVHVTALHFVPREGLDALALGPRLRVPVEASPDMDARYASGRDIGDEYRYVLARRHARHFAGNLLPKPGALLTPWATQETSTLADKVEAGDEFQAERKKREQRSDHPGIPRASQSPAQHSASQISHEFLPRPAVVLPNLALDAQGQLLIPLARLGGLGLVRVTVVDGSAIVTGEIPLPAGPLAPRDLRLLRPLAPGGHHTQRKQATPRLAGGEIVQEDITTARLEIYDSLAKVFALFQTMLAGDERLGVFAFVPRWMSLDHAEKCALYSEHACHELSFFLSRKDRPFFDAIVAPYLRNKRHRTFLDRYLLGDDLGSYLRPWAYAQLNAAERVLLGERTGERGSIARHLAELGEAQPRSADERSAAFEIALRASSLDADDALGLTAAIAAARDKATPEGGNTPFASITDDDINGMFEEEAEGYGGPPPGAPPPPPGFGPPAGFGPPMGAAAPKAAQEKEVEVDALTASTTSYLDEETTRDVGIRSRSRPLCRPVASTKELAEQHYYRRRLHEHTPELVPPGPFWADLAAHEGPGPFLSPHLHEACRTFTEAMFALSFLDLPFVSETHEVRYEGARLRLVAQGPLVAYEEQIQPANAASGPASVLVGQRYLRAGGAEVSASDEFLTHLPYRTQVVLTNPTPTARDLDVLLQIPQGSVPVTSGQATTGKRISLAPFGVAALEAGFYFPAPGEFRHAPAQVAIDEQVVAEGPGAQLRVVRTSQQIDRDSFEQVARAGSQAEVLALLRTRNLARLDLSLLAWRMQDAAFYREVLALLSGRRTFHRELWGYAFLHVDVPRMQELIETEELFLSCAGSYLDTKTFTFDALERGTYEHLEYAPLVNARAHQPAGSAKILNERFAGQYGRFLDYMSHKPGFDDDDRLSLVIYLLLQDRVDEARAAFARIDEARLPCALQLAYVRCYLAFSSERPGEARATASPQADHPLPRWGSLFRNVLGQLDEAEGAQAAVSDLSDRDQRQGQLASTEPLLELRIEGSEVVLSHQHVPRCWLSYYPMDSELLFSRQPFEQQRSRQFAFVRPARVDRVELGPEGGDLRWPLPEELVGKNLVIEAQGEGVRRAQRHLASRFVVQLMEAYGQLKVTHAPTGAPLPRVYVKVYARLGSGEVRFHKDGYTDLRGRFDYASVSGDGAAIDRFALLILSDEHGAQLREASPPV